MLSTHEQPKTTQPWRTCPIGSCKRHQACMYMPCRSIKCDSPSHTTMQSGITADQRRFYAAGIEEGYRRVLASAQNMTRDMLIRWLKDELL